MSRFVLYFATLLFFQLVLGVSSEIAGVPDYAEASLPVAGSIAAMIFLRPNTLRKAIARLRTTARGVDARILDAIVVGLVLAATLASFALGLSETALTVLAAFTEEVFLRAIPFLILAASAAWTRSTLLTAIAFSAIVFTLGHDLSSWWLTVDKLLFGIAAAVCFLVTSRIWVGFALHALTNVFALWYFATAESATVETFAAVSVLLTMGTLVVIARTVRGAPARDCLPDVPALRSMPGSVAYQAP